MPPVQCVSTAHGGKGLIVEDDGRMRLSLQLLLEGEGHAEELAEERSRPGLEVLSRRPADVVLIDLLLPSSLLLGGSPAPSRWSSAGPP